MKHNNNRDLSKKEKTVTNFLGNNFEKINSLIKNRSALLEFFSLLKEEVHISDEYYNNMINRVKNAKSDLEIQKYLYNIFLKGSNLGVKENEQI